jgi:hypothetical protein
LVPPLSGSKLSPTFRETSPSLPNSFFQRTRGIFRENILLYLEIQFDFVRNRLRTQSSILHCRLIIYTSIDFKIKLTCVDRRGKQISCHPCPNPLSSWHGMRPMNLISHRRHLSIQGSYFAASSCQVTLKWYRVVNCLNTVSKARQLWG